MVPVSVFGGQSPRVIPSCLLRVSGRKVHFNVEGLFVSWTPEGSVPEKVIVRLPLIIDRVKRVSVCLLIFFCLGVCHRGFTQKKE